MILVTPHDIDIAIRLFVATFLGGLIGVERESHGKDAGFRTHALVCLGSALMMVVSIQIFELYRDQGTVDPSRIAAQVVSGIGFLGAGAIISDSSGTAEEKIKAFEENGIAVAQRPVDIVGLIQDVLPA